MLNVKCHNTNDTLRMGLQLLRLVSFEEGKISTLE